jgi:hypothetical protein
VVVPWKEVAIAAVFPPLPILPCNTTHYNTLSPYTVAEEAKAAGGGWLAIWERAGVGVGGWRGAARY